MSYTTDSFLCISQVQLDNYIGIVPFPGMIIERTPRKEPLESPDVRQRALADPRGFLKELAGGAILGDQCKGEMVFYNGEEEFSFKDIKIVNPIKKPDCLTFLDANSDCSVRVSGVNRRYLSGVLTPVKVYTFSLVPCQATDEVGISLLQHSLLMKLFVSATIFLLTFSHSTISIV